MRSGTSSPANRRRFHSAIPSGPPRSNLSASSRSIAPISPAAMSPISPSSLWPSRASGDDAPHLDHARDRTDHPSPALSGEGPRRSKGGRILSLTVRVEAVPLVEGAGSTTIRGYPGTAIARRLPAVVARCHDAEASRLRGSIVPSFPGAGVSWSLDIGALRHPDALASWYFNRRASRHHHATALEYHAAGASEHQDIATPQHRDATPR
jgi:hypothetical protein